MKELWCVCVFVRACMCVRVCDSCDMTCFCVQHQDRSLFRGCVLMTPHPLPPCRCYTDNRISVRFEYEWRNEQGQWFRWAGECLAPPFPRAGPVYTRRSRACI
jgi:hypothetical protein